MFVKKLHLKNLRSFKETTLEFSKSINIITGHNNSGKSTIIKALYKIQDEQSMGADDIRLQEYKAEIVIDLAGITAADRRYYFDSRNPITGDTDTSRIEYQIRKKELSKKMFYDHPNKDQLPLSKDFTGFPNTENEHNYIYPFFASRKSNGRYTSLGSGITAYAVTDNFQNLPAKVQKTSSQAKTKEKYQLLCKDILGFEPSAIPGSNNDYKLGSYSGFDSSIALESMGEGVANIIGLITILLTDNNRLFLFEELENDIHPAALKKLLNLIIEKSVNNQFIISTHSNIVLKYLGSLPESRIFYTESNPAENSESDVPLTKVTEAENTKEERLRILQELGYDLFDYDIYKGYLLLEESSAERIIREFIIPWFFPDARNKLRTIAAQGANDLYEKFNDFQNLFLYLHTAGIYKGKAWVIADGDKAGTDAVAELIKKFKEWPPEHFLNFTAGNFEMYYPEIFKADALAALAGGDKKERRRLKNDLLHKVIARLKEDEEAGKAALEKSAAEVIDKLRIIINKIN